MDLPQGNMKIYTGMAGVENVSFDYAVRPLSEIKDSNIVKQQFDYSCGSAALATLLNGYLGEELTEQQVIQGMMQYGDSAQIEERRAFSMLDMKRFAEVLGYKAAGYKADFNDLKTLETPAIVPIEFYGYKHFVVYRGISGDHIFVADPYMGNMSYTSDKFQEIWNPNIVFVISHSDVQTNAMKLTNEDMRIYKFDVTEKVLPQTLPEDFIRKQRQFRESNNPNVLISTMKGIPVFRKNR